MTGINFDITARKQTEEQLAEASRRKDEFLAMLAHELRNPLAPIRNAAEMLRRQGHGQEPPALQMLDRQVAQMTRLIDDLLDVSRISRGKIELRKERLELTQVVKHSVEAVRPISQDLEQTLTIILPADPIYVYADAARLSQVVSNLLNNACKFTDRGGSIRLTVEREDSHAVIRVSDTGVGMAEDQLTRIFEMFTQIDTSLGRSHGGLGIGLTMVKTFVEMHDGTVEAHSDGMGKGSEFVVRLPLLAQESSLQQPQNSQSVNIATNARRRILVVDDNRDSTESLAMLMSLSGHEVFTAYDGLEAVEAAAKFQPDVILMDIGLPNLNGYHAASRIRKQQSRGKVVLVALTGWGQESDRQRSQEAGFNAHLVKPVNYDDLMKLLAELAGP
jgi:CheY-like chemotaxis protein